MTDSVGRVWTGLIRISPHRGDHRVALRAAVSVAVPLLVLWAIGRLDLSIYASFGAFSALYGRHDNYLDRIRMQAGAGLTLVAAMLIGTLLAVVAAPGFLSIILIALAAALITLLAYIWRWHPPGALFVVFAAGACATLPATLTTLIAALLVGGLSVAFGVAVTTTIALFRAGLGSAGLGSAGLGSAGLGSGRVGSGRVGSGGLRGRSARARPPVGAVAWEMAATVGIGMLLAGAAGLLIVGTHWYWAMVGAAAALSGAAVNARLIRGIQRMIGTLIGVVIAAGLLALQMPPLLTITIAVIMQAGAEMFVGRNYGIAMLFITPLALLMVQLAAPSDPARLLRDRILDTLIGVTIGTLIAIASATLRRSRSPTSI